MVSRAVYRRWFFSDVVVPGVTHRRVVAIVARLTCVQSPSQASPFWLLVEDVCIAISMAVIEQQVASLAAMSMNYQSKSGYVIKCSGRELAL